jgi:hypothetical protein
MNKKELVALGVDEETADKIVALHGKDIEKHKSDISAAQSEAAALKSQLTEAAGTVESFKKLDVDGIKKAADEYKSKYEQATVEAQKNLLEYKRGIALDKALKETYKIKDVELKSAKAHLDTSKLLFDENTETFTGLKEQVEPLVPVHEGWFVNDNPLPRIVARGNSQSVLGDKVIDAARVAAGLVKP